MGQPDIHKLKQRGNVKKLRKLLHTKELAIVAEAAKALREINTEQSITELISGLLGVEGLQRQIIQKEVISMGNKAIEPLLAALQQPSELPERRGWIIRTLGSIGDTRVADMLVQYLDDDQLNFSAAAALADLGDDRAITPLYERIQAFELSKVWIIETSIKHLKNMETPRSREVLMGFLDHEELLVKEMACKALIENERDAVIPIVMDMLNEEGDGRFYAMTLIGDHQIYDALPRLIEIIEDSQRPYAERGNAAHAIGKMPLSGWLDKFIPDSSILNALAKFILEEVDLCNADKHFPRWCYAEGIRLFVSIGGKNAILDFIDNLRSMSDAPHWEEEYWLRFSQYGGKAAEEALKERMER
jgi:hypothetical protein